MLLRVLLFTALPIVCFSSYIFPPIKMQAVGNYKNNMLQWSFGQDNLLDPNAIIEDIPSLNTFLFGPAIEFNRPNLFFFRTKFLYGYGSDSKAKAQMRILSENDTSQIFERILGLFDYKLLSHTSDFLISGGFPLTWGPFSIIPNIGWGFIFQRYERKNISAHQFNNQTSASGTIATFNPTNHFKNSFYAPFIGIIFQITPIAGGRLQLDIDYTFHYGTFKTHSGYSLFTDVLQTAPFRQTIRRVKQTVSLTKSSLSHQLSLQTTLGIYRYLSSHLLLQYRYFRANSTNSTQTLKGTQNLSASPGQVTTTDIDETVERPFHGMKGQSFGVEVSLNMQV